VKGLNGGFRHWQVSGVAISSVAACFSSQNIQSVDFASFQPSRSQHNPFRLVFGLHLCPTTTCLPPFCTISFATPLTQRKIPDTTSHIKIFNLIWQELL